MRVYARLWLCVLFCFLFVVDRTSLCQVLSDPQKRELYDQLGETGMLMMEDPFAAKDVRHGTGQRPPRRQRSFGIVLVW